LASEEMTAPVRPRAGAVFIKRPPTEAALLFGPEPLDEPVVLPKLNVMALDKLLGGFYRRVVVGAVEIKGVLKMAVAANDVRSIVRHAMCPLARAGAQHSQSPITAEAGAVIHLELSQRG
jgi:hypothetical protein